MDSPLLSRICTNSSCGFADTGQCVEGNDTIECPFLRDAPKDGTESHNDTEEIQADKANSTNVQLSSGANLEIHEASTLLKSTFAPIIAFLGPVDAGKTSLIAEVYDAFQFGSYKTLKFAGSTSLVAFEEVCHLVRAASKGNTPSVNRTPIAVDPIFYHLCIANDNEKLSHLLFADRSGETYEQLKNEPGSTMSFLELKRANIINILVDGDRLCNPTKRAGVISQCAQTVQALVLSEAMECCDHINLVLTKLDLVDNHANSKKVHEDFDSLPDIIAVQCSNRNPPIYTHKVAACPHNETHPKGQGVEKLLLRWLKTGPSIEIFDAQHIEHVRAFSQIPKTKDSM